MNTKEYLHFLQKGIHSTAMATIGSDGHPQTRMIDIMLADDACLFYHSQRKRILPAADGAEICCLDRNEPEKAGCFFARQDQERQFFAAGKGVYRKQNPYMKEIYPQQESRSALEVFCIYEGQGEFFDLSCTPIFRDTFVLGNAQAQKSGYFVQATCIGCKLCYSVCPQKCIDIAEKPAVIRQEHCLHCGRCEEICPVHAVQRIGG